MAGFPSAVQWEKAPTLPEDVMPTQPTKPKVKIPNRGVLQELLLRGRLILRLLRDPRVPWYLKLLPVGATVYLVAPDLLPLNPLDDTVIVGLGFYLFVELCPEAVVSEHLRALERVVPGTWREAPLEETRPPILEGQAREPEEGP